MGGGDGRLTPAEDMMYVYEEVEESDQAGFTWRVRKGRSMKYGAGMGGGGIDREDKYRKTGEEARTVEVGYGELL